MRVSDTQYGGNLDLNYNKIVNLRDSGTRVPNDVVWDNREDFELIGHTELSADAANIEFANIPGRYRHLLLQASLRSTQVTALDTIKLQFNGDTAANYDAAYYRVDDAAALSGSGNDGPAVSALVPGVYPGSSAPANVFNPTTIWIPDYVNRARHKSIVATGGIVEGTAAGNIETGEGAGRWRNTSAITQVTLAPQSGNWVSGSTASLYGIRSKRFLVDPTNTLCDKLVAYWKLDETGGKRLDSWGANHLTDNNTVTYAPGLRGNAARFFADGSEYLSVADNADVSTGDVNYTIACWVILHSKAGMTFAAKWDGTTDEYTLGYGSGPDRFQFSIRNSANTATTTEAADNLGSPSTGAWYFIVAWHDATNDELGIQVNNGKPDTQSYTGGGRDTATQFTVGARTSPGGEYVNGLIQNVGIWKKVLTPAERTALFNRGRGNTLINT